MACNTLSQIAPLKIGGVVLDTHYYGIAGSKFNAVSIKQSSQVYWKQNLIFQGSLKGEN